MSRNGWHDLDTTSKQRILVLTDFSYDFLQAVNSNFCTRTHCLATIHNVTDRQTTDRRNTVPIVRPLVRSAKNTKNLHQSIINHPWDQLATNEPKFSRKTPSNWCTRVCIGRRTFQLSNQCKEFQWNLVLTGPSTMRQFLQSSTDTVAAWSSTNIVQFYNTQQTVNSQDSRQAPSEQGRLILQYSQAHTMSASWYVGCSSR